MAKQPQVQEEERVEAAAQQEPASAPEDATPAPPATAQQEPGQAAEADAERRIAALQSELLAARSERDGLSEQVLRVRAEIDNLRKRTQRDIENAHKYALERFVAELLPVKDSMEMGLAASAEEGADVAKLREGSELTLKMLSAAVEKFGVSAVDPLGEPFNPELHQAMTTEEAGDAAPGSVTRVVQKGYLLNDRLVRPALVVVAK